MNDNTRRNLSAMSWQDTARKLMREKNITQERLADRVGRTQGAVGHWLNGRREPSMDDLKLVAKELGITIAELLHEELGLADELEDVPPLVQSTPTPVVGHVQGGGDGFLVELEYPAGHGDGLLMHYSKDANAYGLRVKGDSMRPRIKAGEYIVCEPNRATHPGDDVVAIFKDGRRMVKELLYIRDGEVSLGSINNGHQPVTVSLEDLDAMHYVAAIMPRGAFIKE